MTPMMVTVRMMIRGTSSVPSFVPTNGAAEKKGKKKFQNYFNKII